MTSGLMNCAPGGGVPAYDSPRELKPGRYIPGAPERFLKERGQPAMPDSNPMPALACVDTWALGAMAFGEADAGDMTLRLASCLTLLYSNRRGAELKAAHAREMNLINADLRSRLERILPYRPLASEIEYVRQIGYLRGADLWHIATALYIARAIPCKDASVRNPGHLLASGRGGGLLHLALFGVEAVAEPVAEEVH